MVQASRQHRLGQARQPQAKRASDGNRVPGEPQRALALVPGAAQEFHLADVVGGGEEVGHAQAARGEPAQGVAEGGGGGAAVGEGVL